MHIFGDPSRIPIVIIERVANAPMRTTSGNSYFSHPDHKDTHSMLSDLGSKETNKIRDTLPRSGRILKIVVFVHGFQACSALLQLPTEIFYESFVVYQLSLVRQICQLDICFSFKLDTMV